VQTRVAQAARRLPREIDPPIITKTNPEDNPIMWLSISGTRSPIFMADYVRNVLRPQFQTIEGVGEVFIGGYRERSVRVWFDAPRLEAQGLTVLGFEGTSETANFDGIIQPILALAPEAIYFGGIYSQTAIFIQQARAAGYAGKFIGPDGFDSSEFAGIAGDAAVGTYYTTVAAPASFYPDAATFAADYEAKFGEAVQPFGAQAYDATGIVLKAIELAAKRSGGEVPSRALVASIVRATRDYKGITGTYSFDAVGDPVEAQYYIIEVTSANPDDWGANSLLEQQIGASPLANAAAGE
jgi:branched-chain amino acid transport system substrate-binding protein